MIVAIAAVLVLIKARSVKFGQINIDLSKETGKHQDTESNLTVSSDISLSTNEKQFLLLKQYHSQGLSQSRVSFWFSLIFAALGFAVIVIAILAANKDKSFWEQSNSIISLLSGTIIDAVSALFFVQSNRSRELMANFFEKLRADRKIEESLKLCDEIPDDYLRSKLKLVLSLHFAEITPSDNIISMVFRELKDKQENRPGTIPDP
jgi:hypothetical protein